MDENAPVNCLCRENADSSSVETVAETGLGPMFGLSSWRTEKHRRAENRTQGIHTTFCQVPRLDGRCDFRVAGSSCEDGNRDAQGPLGGDSRQSSNRRRIRSNKSRLTGLEHCGIGRCLFLVDLLGSGL